VVRASRVPVQTTRHDEHARCTHERHDADQRARNRDFGETARARARARPLT
jgi:hypothetical protein